MCRDPRKADASILKRAFSLHTLSAAVQTELRRVRNHKIGGGKPIRSTQRSLRSA